MPQPQTRPSLLERLRDTADAEAWTTFEATYGDLVLRYCARCGIAPADADDVRQIAFLKLMRALQSFQYDRSRGRFRDYFYQVVRSAIADRAARAGRSPAPAPVDLFAEAPPAPPADDIWRHEWEQFHLQRAWSEIERAVEPRSLQVFRILLDGQSVRAAAARFEMTEDAVEKIRQRMRTRLRQRIEAQVREEDGIAG